MGLKSVPVFLACTVALLPSLGINSAAAMNIGPGQIYTSIGDSRKDKTGLCKVEWSSGESDNALVRSRCPSGPDGWPVTMFSADARDMIYFGRQAAGTRIGEALQGAFADPQSTIEWRLNGNQPYAAIQRYSFGRSQVLTVHRLNQDRTSCVAAIVAVEKGRDANVEAARFADEKIASFHCGVDKLVKIGAVDVLLQPR